MYHRVNMLANFILINVYYSSQMSYLQLHAGCMDRPMTLYFWIYETVCLLLGVLCMAAVLQGGTTNWMVRVFFVGVYFMIAAGFALHEQESLSFDID